MYNVLRLAFFTQYYSLEIHLGCCIINSSFLFVAEQYSIIRIYQSLFNHSTFEGHLGCIQFLAIVNKAAVNIYRQDLCEHKSLFSRINAQEHNC